MPAGAPLPRVGDREMEKTEGLVQITVRHRPIGISVMAILAFLFGLLVTLLGALFIAGGAAASNSLSSSFGSVIGGALAVVGVIILLLGLLYLVFAVGAWKLKGWAWWLGVIGSVLFILLGILSYSGASSTGDSPTGAIVFIVISVLIFLYLLTPGVRRAFRH
jgi:uncharacterized membrane protein (DUF2068 family)